MLVHSSVSASSCTGSYSAEMSLAAVQSTVNSSRWLSKPVHIRCAKCFDTSLVFNLEVRFKCKTDLDNSQMIGTSGPQCIPRENNSIEATTKQHQPKCSNENYAIMLISVFT